MHHSNRLDLRGIWVVSTQTIVVEKVRDNRFVIKTSKPGVEV